MVLAAMAPGSVVRPLRGEGLPKAREPLDLVCGASVSRYASCLLCSCVGATLSSTAVLDILTISVQRFDAQPALDVHEVSFLVFGALTINVPPLVEPPGSINASIALICEARAAANVCCGVED